jgi:hypothetical protein
VAETSKSSGLRITSTKKPDDDFSDLREYVEVAEGGVIDSSVVRLSAESSENNPTIAEIRHLKPR